MVSEGSIKLDEILILDVCPHRLHLRESSVVIQFPLFTVPRSGVLTVF